MKKLFKAILFLPILILMVLQPSAEAGTFEMVTGWEGNDIQGYTFLSPSYNMAIGINKYLVLRTSVNYLYYEFDDVDGRTEVTSPGADAGVAFRWSRNRLSISIGPGYEIRQTERNFEGGGNLEQTEEGFNLQGSLFFQATPLTNLNIISSYSDANKYIWVRGGVKRQVTNKSFEGPRALSLGVEFTGQGNDDISLYSGGILFEIAFFRKKFSIQMRAGYSFYQSPESSERSKPYFGVGAYKAF